MNLTNKIIAVAGPTASGKSSLAISLAKELGGEVISCDSMQIYKEMQIGTAKVLPSEMQGVPHHLIDFLPVQQSYSVSDYVSAAKAAIALVQKKGKVPIVVGGTGLYMRSLLWGVNFQENSRSQELRESLTREAENGEIQRLYKQLEKLDPQAAEKIHINNKQRVVRALEYCLVTGKEFSKQSIISTPQFEFYQLCIGFKNRQILYNRINRRVDEMMSTGLEPEARWLYNISSKTALQAIGYKELFPYFKGELSLPEAVENIKRETRRYAKRQLTWFRAEKDINFIYADEYGGEKQLFIAALQLIHEYFTNS